MKILVADDDTIARKVLQTFLRQSQHDVIVVENGNQALEVMLGPDAPHVAIFDWMMPGLSGPELCTRLREHTFPVQPYLIILSARKEKHDIATALDAGADDFLIKPFNIVETQARLRVAARAIERQLGLHRQITQSQAALQEHVALFEPESLETEATAALLDNVGALQPELIEPALFEALSAASGQAMRIVPPPENFDHVVLGWSGFLLTREELWIDVLLEAPIATAEQLYAEAHGVRAEPENLKTFCAGLQVALTDGLTQRLRSRRTPFFVPLDPQAPLCERSPLLRSLARRAGKTWFLAAGETPVSVSLLPLRSPLVRKNATELRRLDVLVRSYPPPELEEIMLMPEGLALTQRLINRIGIDAQGREHPPLIDVHRVSALARHYNRNHVSHVAAEL